MAKEMEVKVPDIGDFDSVPVIDILVKVGDQVEKEASLVTLESDKATMDVPAPVAGTIKSIQIKIGDKVAKGSAVLVLEVGDDEAPKLAEKASSSKPDLPAQKPSAKDDGKDKKPTAEAAEAAKPKKSEPEKAGSPAKNAKSATREIKVPDIGDYKDVPVIEVLVKDGDHVDKDASLLTLESDKATLDVPAPAAGVVRGLKVKVGDKVSKGSPVCTIESDAGTGEETASPASSKQLDQADRAPGKESDAAVSAGTLGAATPAAPASPLPADHAAQPAESSSRETSSQNLPHASPSIRKFARELGVDLSRVKGSGLKERITREDVQGFVKKALAPSAAGETGGGIPAIPVVDFAQFGEIEIKPLARIRKLSKAHLHRAWLNVPHVTQTDEADITELEEFRKTQSAEISAGGGPKLTLLPFVLKAVAKSMAAYPEFASSLDASGDNLVMKKYLHIGFAADTPNGLVVPVVRDVDRKGVVELAKETAELAKKARDGKLKSDEMKGGCFSVSSLGGIGGGFFTPIVNAPEVAILGVSRAQMKPVWDGKAFQPRLMLPLSLSYDHRVIDGAYAARFIVHLSGQLADLRRLVL